MQNSFDIVIPTFNRAHSIDCAINSVLNQTYTKWNLFILDNCSTDDTQEVVSKYLSNSKIKYIRNEKNIGIARNWYKALVDIGNEPFTVTLHDDDELKSNFLERANTGILSFPDLGLYTSSVYINRNGNLDEYLIDSIDKTNKVFEVCKPCENLYYFLKGCPIPAAAVVIRKSALKEIEDRAFAHASWYTFDRYWFAQVALKYTVVFNLTPTSIYNFHDGSGTNNLKINKFEVNNHKLLVGAFILNLALSGGFLNVDEIQNEINKIKDKSILDLLCGMVLYGNKELHELALKYYKNNLNRSVFAEIQLKEKIAFRIFGLKITAFLKMYISRI